MHYTLPQGYVMLRGTRPLLQSSTITIVLWGLPESSAVFLKPLMFLLDTALYL